MTSKDGRDSRIKSSEGGAGKTAQLTMGTLQRTQVQFPALTQ